MKAESDAPNDLERAIVQAGGGEGGVPVEIAADPDSRFRAYVRLLDVLQKLNFTDIRVAPFQEDRLDSN